MKWTKLTIDTTCEAEDLISAFLEEEGVLGVQIEDNIPLTEEEMETMFVDLLPDDMPENDGTAKVSCFLDDTFDVQEIKDKVAAEIRRLSEFLPVGTGKITESETKEEDWRDNWKAYFKPFRLYDNIIIKPTWEEVPEDATDEDIVIEIDPGTAFGTGSHETTKLCIEGMKPYINPKTKRIHSFFHQTITATGRISSTEPNLQNIPTRIELGKQLRKVFKPEKGNVYIDADYSQIELRVLAHMSEDKHMITAFLNGEDIHKQAASKVLHKPIDEVTKEERSSAKAVNFGIVYGISEFGLGEQLGVSRKEAKAYIDQYLEEYSGIKNYMDKVVEEAKEKGYAKTMFNRKRYIKELTSSNYMVREFGKRAAMNTPIQGTAADIMKIAMINVYKKLKENNMKSKIVLQVHDEMMIEAPVEEKEKVKKIIKNCMEDAAKLRVPLLAEVSEANSWYECK